MHGSLTTVPNGDICHIETMGVVLHSYSKGNYGFSVNKQQVLRPGDDPNMPLFISYIEKGSPAERSGVLQVGDRILTINDWCTANATVEEASKRIRNSPSPLTLTVEFDVIESVIPSNGILNVKLAKRGNNLGIVVRCESDCKKGEPVIISDIRTGSVAHRCGSIQIGDRVLAIDNIPLTSCTVEEAMRLLKRSGEVVKLRIRKSSGPGSEEAELLQRVVYSIELNRKGRPVGITIASRGEVGDPVIISQLAPNGLAERTGAFRVGDQILAINGESIEGKKVSDAIWLLQQNADLVRIKISRVLEPATAAYTAFYNSASMSNSQRARQSRTTVPSDSFSEASEKMGTPIQSIDSAVESLEDSPIGQQRASSVTRRISAQEQNLKHRSGGDDRVDWQVAHDYVNNNTTEQSPLSSLMQHPCANLNSTSFANGLQTQETYGWDSGLSSTTDNNAQECCLCQKATTSDTEDWVKILEALETVGEAEMLQKLEDSIMGGNVPMCKHSRSTTNNLPSTSLGHSAIPPLQSPSTASRQQWQPFAPSAANTILRQPAANSNNFTRSQVPHPLTQMRDLLSSERGEAISMKSNNSGSSFGSNVPPSMPPPKPPRFEAKEAASMLDTFKRTFDSDLIPYITSPVPNQSMDADQGLTVTPSLVLHELCPKVQASTSALKKKGATHRVTLHKDPVTDSFGFSVSDGVGENPGVYINTLLPGGPADKSGNIFPLDRILQVNDTSLEYLDCDIAVPLLNVDKIDLVLYRETPKPVSNRADDSGNTNFVSSINHNLKDSSV